MKTNRPLLGLGWLVALLTIIYAGAGLFWESAGSPYEFVTLHGETVLINGHGIYHYDTLFSAQGFRGTDAVTLFIVVPLLMVVTLINRRETLRGRLLLAGVLSYFLYNAISLAFSAAYNNLVFVYILSLTASLFAFALALASVDLLALPSRIQPGLPHRVVAGFLFFTGAAVGLIWLSDMLPAFLQGGVPAVLDSYTTVFTYVFDLSVIMPATILAGVMLLRHTALGYLLSPVLLILCTLIGVVVIGQTLFQSNAGISIPPGQFFGLIGSWVILGAVAVVLLAVFLRKTVD